MLKGQVSIEYLLITAFAFLMTVPIIALFYSQSHQIQEDVTDAQVEKIASELRDAANEVYYQGPPSKRTLKIYMPDNVENVSISNKNIIFKVSSTAGDYEIVKVADTNLTGDINSFSGIHNIEVKARLTDVKIQEAK